MQIIACQSVSDDNKCACAYANSNCVHQSNLNDNNRVSVRARAGVRANVRVRALGYIRLRLRVIVLVVTEHKHTKKRNCKTLRRYCRPTISPTWQGVPPVRPQQYDLNYPMDTASGACSTIAMEVLEQ